MQVSFSITITFLLLVTPWLYTFFTFSVFAYSELITHTTAIDALNVMSLRMLNEEVKERLRVFRIRKQSLKKTSS